MERLEEEEEEEDDEEEAKLLEIRTEEVQTSALAETLGALTLKTKLSKLSTSETRW